MLDIFGLGWINDQCYGQGRDGRQVNYASRVPTKRLGLEDSLFREPVKNFGRFEPVTQKLCTATVLALQDAGITYGEEHLEIGLLAIHKAGCISSNYRFFQDYLDGGRSCSRANLFIYTLPTSPCAEAAIYFDLRGPLLYIDALDDSLDSEIQAVENVLRTHQAQAMLIYMVDEPHLVAIAVRISSVKSDPVVMSSIPKDIEKAIQQISEALERTGRNDED